MVAYFYALHSASQMIKKYIKYQVIVFAAALFFTHKSFSQNPGRNRLQIAPALGYGHTDFTWSIAGDANGQNPNIYSELIWQKLRGPVAGLSAQYGITNRLAAYINTSYLKIATGKVVDTDYDFDNRQGAFYDETLRSNKGYDADLNTGFKYAVINTPHLQMSPAIGYTLQRQYFHLLDWKTTQNARVLKSNYKTLWQGLILGAETNITANRMSYTLNLNARLLDYSAKAQWNLIEEFAQPVSFKHASNGYGIETAFAAAYAVKENIQIKLNTGYSYLKANEGIDVAYYTDGRDPHKTQLNEARSNRYYISLGANFQF